jgi:S-adenosylmethionine decarboxylase
VKLHVTLSVLDGIDAARLDDPAGMRAALDAAVSAGGFTLREMLVARFEPHGVTATAVVGESHLCLHSWPEEGRLFVDIASCSTRESVTRALDAIVAAIPGARVAVRDDRELDGSSAKPG